MQVKQISPSESRQKEVLVACTASEATQLEQLSLQRQLHKLFPGAVGVGVTDFTDGEVSVSIYFRNSNNL